MDYRYGAQCCTEKVTFFFFVNEKDKKNDLDTNCLQTYVIQITLIMSSVANSPETNEQPQLQKRAQNKQNINAACSGLNVNRLSK